MTQPEHATFRIKEGTGAPIPVQFEPSSLQYTVQNQVVEQSGAQGQQAQGQRKQFVTQTNAKLAMDLIFDTTDTGANVVNLTVPIARLMQPQTTETDAEIRTAPPIVIFEWGDYSFEGMIEQYQETIDFFHPTGVPLRSTLKITLASQELQFEQGGERSANTNNTQEMPSGQNPQSLADKGGNPKAAKAIASQNGVESLRFSRGPLTVSAKVELKGPSGFASGKANIGGGIGISGGIGGSVGAGAGVGLGGSAGIGGSAAVGGAQAGVSFGAKASAGVSATSGAFAGLGKASATSANFNLNTGKLMQAGGTAGLSLSGGVSAGAGINAGAGIGAGASFNAAGQPTAGGGAGIRVNLTADGKSKIIFSTDK